MSKLALIVPAKGNSVRIPRKNLVDLGGVPLISHTLDALVAASFADIIVSSDSLEICDIASSFGVRSMFRDSSLCLPDVHSSVVVKDIAVKLGTKYSFIGMALPTLPFRRPETLVRMYDEFMSNNHVSLVSVASLGISLDHIVIRDKEYLGYKRLSKKTNMQDYSIEHIFCLSGYLQLCEFDKFCVNNSFHLEASYHPVPDCESMDINTFYDLEIARGLLAL